MRVIVLLLASVLFACAPAFAQDWELYTSKEDGFKLDFPGTPKMTQTTFKSDTARICLRTSIRPRRDRRNIR